MTQGQLKEFKIAYNKLVLRHKKAEAYLNNNDIPMADREKYLPEFRKLLNNINKAIEDFNANGIEMTADEILEGFARP